VDVTLIGKDIQGPKESVPKVFNAAKNGIDLETISKKVKFKTITTLISGDALVSDGTNTYVKNNSDDLTQVDWPIELTNNISYYQSGITHYPTLNKSILKIGKSSLNPYTYLPSIDIHSADFYEIDENGNYLGKINITGFVQIKSFGFNNDGTKFYVVGSKVPNISRLAVFTFDSNGLNEKQISTITTSPLDYYDVSSFSTNGLIYYLADYSNFYQKTWYYSDFEDTFNLSLGTDNTFPSNVTSAYIADNDQWFIYHRTNNGNLYKRSMNGAVSLTLDSSVVNYQMNSNKVYYLRDNGATIEGDLYCYNLDSLTKTLLYQTPTGESSLDELRVLPNGESVFYLAKNPSNSNQVQLYKNDCTDSSDEFFSFPFGQITDVRRFDVTPDGKNIVLYVELDDNEYGLYHINTTTNTARDFSSSLSGNWHETKNSLIVSADNNKMIQTYYYGQNKRYIVHNFQTNQVFESEHPIINFSIDSNYAYTENLDSGVINLNTFTLQPSTLKTHSSFENYNIERSTISQDKQFLIYDNTTELIATNLIDGSRIKIFQKKPASTTSLKCDKYLSYIANDTPYIISKWSSAGNYGYLKTTNLLTKEEVYLFDNISPFSIDLYELSDNKILYSGDNGDDLDRYNTINLSDNSHTEIFAQERVDEFFETENHFYIYSLNLGFNLLRIDKDGSNSTTILSGIQIASNTMNKNFQVINDRIYFIRESSFDKYAATIDLDGSSMQSAPEILSYMGVSFVPLNSEHFAYKHADDTTLQYSLEVRDKNSANNISILSPGPAQKGVISYSTTPDETRLIYTADEISDFVFDSYSVNFDGTGKIKMSSNNLELGDVSIVIDFSPNSDFVIIKEPLRSSNCFLSYSGTKTALLKNIELKDHFGECMFIEKVKILQDNNTVLILAESQKGKYQNLYKYSVSTDTLAPVFSNSNHKLRVEEFKVQENVNQLIYTSNKGEVNNDTLDIYIMDLSTI
jgi:hypothetical protein